MTVILPSALSLDFNPLPPCGGRPRPACKFRWLAHFNPLPPCGGRRHEALKRQKKTSFQSTPSVWRETAALVRLWFLHFYFNPLPPCGGRRSGSQTYKEYFDISIHSLRVEGDGDLGQIVIWCSISIHSLRVEGDRASDPRYMSMP